MSDLLIGLSTRLRTIVDMTRGVDGEVLSLRAIDRLAGRPEGHLGMILSGERPNPTVETIGAYAPVLGASLDWLLEARGSAPTADEVAAAVRAAEAVLARACDNTSSHIGRARARAPRAGA